MSFTPLFPGHDEHEVVKAILRRHWIRLFDHALWFAVESIIPIVAAILILLFTDIRIEIGSLFYILLIFGISLYYLFITLFFFADLVGYHLDVWVVTNRRLVSIEQLGVFDRVVSEQPILKVQDVTHEIRGKLQTFLNFGNVRIETAGEAEHFIFQDVPHPDLVAKLIIDTHEQAIHAGDVKRVGLFQDKTPVQPAVPDQASQV